MSEREPELGLGVVVSVDRLRIAVTFPASGEQRIYAAGTPVLKRVQFREGETVQPREGQPFAVESVDEEGGLLVYAGKGRRVREDAISDVTSVSSPAERLLAGQVDRGEVFELRHRALQAQARFRGSEVRGFLGGRLELIPHQYFILREVAMRQIPRVLLADEVGLGKTIEACLIVQRLLAVGKAGRVLVLVPESLVHQWFVELLRRFNLWFSIYDEERCLACEASDPGINPFLDEQLALCSVSFLSGNEPRREQAVAAGWDMVVVDEAHHLEWTPQHSSVEYTLVERLAARSPGLLLLTATPTQLGIEGHYARLRLLDPDRYRDFEAFQREAADFGAVTAVIEKIIEMDSVGAPLAGVPGGVRSKNGTPAGGAPAERKAGSFQLPPADRKTLTRLFDRDSDGLAKLLAALEAGTAGAREALLKTLLDQHGTGRVMFRNTRAAMTGFPKRKLVPALIKSDDSTLRARIGREIEAEETGNEAAVRFSFKDDPRIEWLASFLKRHKTAKVLLICKSQRKVGAIEAALKERINARIGLFHEGLPLVQRDRNAAWFAEPGGAQLLICSEIGSEGRNFQFAHHLVLFDLPLNPGLVEQRIGRLDRIGQTETIQIHVPCVAGSAEEVLLEWYQKGLDSFETPLHGGSEFLALFKERLLVLALAYGEGKAKSGRAELDAFLAETAKFRRELDAKMKKGRDRLLELNSFDRPTAEKVIERVRAADTDPFLRAFLSELMEHFGVRIADHEGGDVFLDPSHAFVEAYPSIPPEGMLATFDRRRAIAREDIKFITADHSVVRDSIDLLVNSPVGSSAFCLLDSDEPNLLLEAVFVLETVAESRWHVDQFLAPTPVRVVVDVRGRELTASRSTAELERDGEDGNIHRFLEKPGFTAALLKSMIEGATGLATERTDALKKAARASAQAMLGAELQRLVDLQKVNDHVRPAEIGLAREQLQRTAEAIDNARLRFDSLRLIVEGPVGED